MFCPSNILRYSEGVDTLNESLRQPSSRIVLFGPPGAGKSFLAAELAKRMQSEGKPCACLSADPGSPGFGIPAAINLGIWKETGWQLTDFEALCSLDAARFRLPLTEALRSLMLRIPAEIPLIIDAPGLIKGVAAAELLPSLIDITAPTQLAVLDKFTNKDSPESPACSVSLENEIANLNVPVIAITSSELAISPNRHQRALRRTALWEQYLNTCSEMELDIRTPKLLGTPPPVDHPEKWAGLVIKLTNSDGVTSMGEIIELEDHQLKIYCQSFKQPTDQLLVRDARHLPGHLLVTAVPKHAAGGASDAHRQKTDTQSLVHPSDVKPLRNTPRIRRRDITAELVNGLFDDPLLLIKTNQNRRCLLFDLGNTSRLPVRHAHNVSHIFISHAHFDHIGGFMGLLRVRLSTSGSCQLYGPPGLARHIAGMISGILWDRIGDSGPVFTVSELHGNKLCRFRLQAGHHEIPILPEITVHDGIIHREERFIIRTVELDHGTPVLAFSYEPVAAVSVSKSALKELNLPPGPWLGKLKYAYMAGEQDQLIDLPNGESQPVAVLAKQLLRMQAGKKIVYATDLADTADNRKKLTALAGDADVLFCEATFSQDDVRRGTDNGHLTTRACGEIAAAAGVNQLVPFHFSRRYEKQADKLYREIEEVFPNIVRCD